MKEGYTDTRMDLTLEKGKMALILWARHISREYNIKIRDFGVSWQDGLALCSILHKYLSPKHPDWIDFKSLTAGEEGENLKIAFEAAEKAGFPALINSHDMTDKRSIFTYVSYLYHFFHCACEGYMSVWFEDEWGKEWVRLRHHRLLIMRPSKILKEIDLGYSSLRFIPSSSVHKEVRHVEIQKHDLNAIVLHHTPPNGPPETFILFGQSNDELREWFEILHLAYLEAHRIREDKEPALRKKAANLSLKDDIHHSGKLYKLGDKGIKKDWKQRHFELKNDILSYAHLKTPSKIIDQYSMQLCQKIEISNIDIHPFSIILTFPLRRFILRADSKESLEEWRSHLHRALSLSRNSVIDPFPIVDSQTNKSSHLSLVQKKEGHLSLELKDSPVEQVYCVLQYGYLTCYSNESLEGDPVLKLSLFEVEIEILEENTSGNEYKKHVRITTSPGDKLAKLIYLWSPDTENTFEWYKTILGQRIAMERLVNNIAFPRSEDLPKKQAWPFIFFKPFDE